MARGEPAGLDLSTARRSYNVYVFSGQGWSDHMSLVFQPYHENPRDGPIEYCHTVELVNVSEQEGPSVLCQDVTHLKHKFLSRQMDYTVDDMACTGLCAIARGLFTYGAYFNTYDVSRISCDAFARSLEKLIREKCQTSPNGVGSGDPFRLQWWQKMRSGVLDTTRVLFNLPYNAGLVVLLLFWPDLSWLACAAYLFFFYKEGWKELQGYTFENKTMGRLAMLFLSARSIGAIHIIHSWFHGDITGMILDFVLLGIWLFLEDCHNHFLTQGNTWRKSVGPTSGKSFQKEVFGEEVFGLIKKFDLDGSIALVLLSGSQISFFALCHIGLSLVMLLRTFYQEMKGVEYFNRTDYFRNEFAAILILFSFCFKQPENLLSFQGDFTHICFHLHCFLLLAYCCVAFHHNTQACEQACQQALKEISLITESMARQKLFTTVDLSLLPESFSHVLSFAAFMHQKVTPALKRSSVLLMPLFFVYAVVLVVLGIFGIYY